VWIFNPIMILFAVVNEPDVIASHGRYINGTWIWLRDNSPIDKTVLGWTSFPTEENGDCIGLLKKAKSATVYPCIYPKRVMCSYS
jgi:hypothetical protein